MTRCLLAVGANLGDRAATLRTALQLISALPGVQLLARSTWHETHAVGGPADQGKFLNGAILLNTQLAPNQVATALQNIEIQLGRDRQIRWDARTIDVDLLLFGDEEFDTSDLTIPHPRMSFRQFVLAPAAEIAGEMVHHPSGWTLAALLRHLRTAPREVAIIADDRKMKKWLESEMKRELGSDSSHSAAVKLVSLEADGGRQPALAIFVGATGYSHGPTLRIAATDPAVILQEAVAAVRAAWPD